MNGDPPPEEAVGAAGAAGTAGAFGAAGAAGAAAVVAGVAVDAADAAATLVSAAGQAEDQRAGHSQVESPLLRHPTQKLPESHGLVEP